MPYTPKHACRYPNCPELVADGAYCEKHRNQEQQHYNRNVRDEDSKRFYNSTAWRALSKRQLQREPLCTECLKAGRAQPAEIADHIVAIKDGGVRLDEANLQSLCKSCHSRKHA
jgi:5-methylcytosine-specific restriction protein A